MAGTFTGAYAQNTPAPVLTLVVDETQAARRIASVREEIRVRPGRLALSYPLWIPGDHGPTGPIEQFAALRISSGNMALHWTRDPEEIATIYVEIPANTDRITVDFNTLLENTISDHQLLLAWNTVMLYPRSIDKRQLMIEPSVLLPANWQQGSSLLVTSRTGNRVNFAPVSLERLIDSPMLAGEFFRAAPTDGLEAAGWRLVYNATPNNERFDNDILPVSYDGTYSIGMYLKKDGTIIDVIQGTPAYDAGLGPHMTIVGVDGHIYSDEALNDSIAHPRNGKISLIVRNFNSVESREIQYAGGVRYPHLERIQGSHDYLSEILEPRSYKDH
jgi:predicted metalloprotease with PDZ domain